MFVTGVMHNAAKRWFIRCDETDPETPRMFGSHITSEWGVTLFLSLVYQQRNAHYWLRPAGLQNNPPKSTLKSWFEELSHFRVICRSLEHSVSVTKPTSCGSVLQLSSLFSNLPARERIAQSHPPSHPKLNQSFPIFLLGATRTKSY